MSAVPDNFHSVLVSWAKIILPVCGIAIFSTLFLFARGGDDPSELPMAELQSLAREQRISAPQFSGVADNGAIISVGAKSARPSDDDTSIMMATDLSLSVDAPDGNNLSVTASQGTLNGSAKRARLDGLTRLETSTGYIMETNGLTADLANGSVVSDGALEIRAPFGTVTAGKVTFSAGSADQGQQILFTHGVRLVYTAENADAKDGTE